MRCVVYTGDLSFDVSRESILNRVQQRFNITLPKSDPKNLEFISLKCRYWLEANRYPHFTLLGQSFGSLIVALEACWKFLPDIYIDTMGYAFTLPVFKFLGGCKTACYVHYPTISTDMLDRVAKRTATYNNDSAVSGSSFRTSAKLVYYRIFAFMYGLAGKASDLTMVNSSWTQAHIDSLWGVKSRVCFPPCDVSEFLQLPLNAKAQPIRTIVSVSQFRPEKDHRLQIDSFRKFTESYLPEGTRPEHFRLVLVGSCRDSDDEKRVSDLKEYCEVKEISHLVDFK